MCHSILDTFNIYTYKESRIIYSIRKKFILSTRIVRKWNNYNVLETISVASKEIITRITKYLATSIINFSSFYKLTFYVLNVAEK